MQIFVDTQIITMFRFLENPGAFLPPNVTDGPIEFIVTMPVVRELERIKDEHYSKHQRERARVMLESLESKKVPSHWPDGCKLLFKWSEMTRQQMDAHGHQPSTPDDFFLAAVEMHGFAYNSGTYQRYLLSDDIGVRIRAVHRWQHCTAYAPDRKLRHDSVEFNLPQLVKAAVKELAVEISNSLREMERSEKATAEETA